MQPSYVEPVEEVGPANYAFEYAVNDALTNVNLGHRENRDGEAKMIKNQKNNCLCPSSQCPTFEKLFIATCWDMCLIQIWVLKWSTNKGFHKRALLGISLPFQNLLEI